MSLSSFSLVIGVLLYVFGFPLVFSDESFMEWKKKVLKDENMLRIAGAAITAMAVTTLRYQWRITQDGEGVIIAVAWMVLAKGLFVAWWPRKYAALRERWFQKLDGGEGAFIAFWGFLMVLLGAVFTYFGLLLA
jgi:hypothetical protein